MALKFIYSPLFSLIIIRIQRQNFTYPNLKKKNLSSIVLSLIAQGFSIDTLQFTIWVFKHICRKKTITYSTFFFITKYPSPNKKFNYLTIIFYKYFKKQSIIALENNLSLYFYCTIFVLKF